MFYRYSTDAQLAGHLSTLNAEAREKQWPESARLAICAAKEIHRRAIEKLERI